MIRSVETRLYETTGGAAVETSPGLTSEVSNSASRAGLVWSRAIDVKPSARTRASHGNSRNTRGGLYAPRCSLMIRSVEISQQHWEQASTAIRP